MVKGVMLGRVGIEGCWFRYALEQGIPELQHKISWGLELDEFQVSFNIENTSYQWRAPNPNLNAGGQVLGNICSPSLLHPQVLINFQFYLFFSLNYLSTTYAPD